MNTLPDSPPQADATAWPIRLNPYSRTFPTPMPLTRRFPRRRSHSNGAARPSRGRAGRAGARRPRRHRPVQRHAGRPAAVRGSGGPGLARHCRGARRVRTPGRPARQERPGGERDAAVSRPAGHAGPRSHPPAAGGSRRQGVLGPQAMRALAAIRPPPAGPAGKVFRLSGSQVSRRIAAAARAAGLGRDSAATARASAWPRVSPPAAPACPSSCRPDAGSPVPCPRSTSAPRRQATALWPSTTQPGRPPTERSSGASWHGLARLAPRSPCLRGYSRPPRPWKAALRASSLLTIPGFNPE